LAAQDNGVPFYVALPGPTIDWEIDDGVANIPIEVRGSREVDYISGITEAGKVEEVRILPNFSKSKNYAFDVTPARLVTGLITERGICDASKAGLAQLFGR
jgi:methylthioribose-1-phosphate isomerase